MPIFDFHTHPWRPTDLATGTVAFIRRISPAVQRWGDRLADIRFAADRLRDDDVEHAVLLAEHCPKSSGTVRTETVLRLCQESDGFFVPFGCVDPNSDPEPVDLLRDYIDQGIRGLKLYPSYQHYYPNERRLYPIYELCQEHRLPLLLHVGSSVIPGTYMKYCDPIHLDDVAVDFPAMPIIMAHGGRGFWYEKCQFLAAHHANVHIDVTGLPPGRLLQFFPNMEALADKFVFGSDWPAMPKSPGANAAVLRTLGLSDDALDRILRSNALRLLRPDPRGAAVA
jgi:uncharacterized protein